MAAGTLLALIDDIAIVLDDVALLTKIAAKKTAGLLGDDLALNAQQVTGVRAEREIPVVWAVAKGSFLNKLILVPVALLLSAFVPWLITPLLMLGGAYLCYEGFEKVFHTLFHKDEKHEEKKQLHDALMNPDLDMVAFEKDKIKGAIRTDFILSAEIIVIALGTVSDAVFATRFMVVAAIAFVMTVGVYGLVAGIVKLDDAGMHLMNNGNEGEFKYGVGKLLLSSCPFLMKTLSFAGTVAMFLVGGGILVHGLPFLHHLSEELIHVFESYQILTSLLPILFTFFAGIIAGGILVGGATGIKAALGK